METLQLGRLRHGKYRKVVTAKAPDAIVSKWVVLGAEAYREFCKLMDQDLHQSGLRIMENYMKAMKMH